MAAARTGRPGLHGGWLCLASSLLAGTLGVTRALSPEGTTSLSFGAVRVVLGGAALVVVAWWSGGLRRWAAVPWGSLAVGGVCFAAYQPLFFTAVDRTGVAVTTILAIGSAPVLAGLLAWLVRGERPGRAWLTATPLAVAGGGLLSTSGGEVRVELLGVLLALGAGAAFATYTVTSKRLLDTFDPVEAMALLVGSAAVLLLPALLLTPTAWITTPRGTLVALHLGLLGTALSYTFFGRGLTRVRVSTAATISLAEPVFATLLGVLVLGERLTATGMAGTALVLVGLAVLARGEPQTRSVGS